MKLKTTGKWKSVELDPFLQAKGFSEGLLGIEELPASSYNISGKKNKASYFSGDIDANKENNESSDNNDEDSGVEDNSEGGKYVRKRTLLSDDEPSSPPKKKKKTRQKRKPKEKRTKVDQNVPSNKTGKNDDMQIPKTTPRTAKQMLAWDGFDLHSSLTKALCDNGFDTPTSIQKEVIPAAIQDRLDILAAAETGSGKTLAFGLPMLNGIIRAKEENIENENSSNDISDPDEDPENENHDSELLESDFEDMSEDDEEKGGCVKVVNNVEFDFDIDTDETIKQLNKQNQGKPQKLKKLQALVLTPTRELAIQVKDHLVAAAKYTNIQVAVVVGGMAPQKQARILKRCPEIVVATPGRLWDLIEEGEPHLQGVTNLRYLAIDETDRMLEKGHFDELLKLLEMTNRNKSAVNKRQNFVVSATLSLVHDLPKHLKHKRNKKQLTSDEKLKEIMDMIGVKPNPKIVDITRKAATAQTLIESQIRCTLAEKDQFLYYFFTQHPGRTLVFCNSIDCVRRLVNLFQILDCEPLGLHAQMQQRQRLKNLDRFISNPSAVLIATDVAARGLDIKDVQHVIHYQVPRTAESYVHRSGRTARAQKEGLSVIMIEPGESTTYKKTCFTLGRKDELPIFPTDNSILSIVKQRVQTAREVDKLLLTTKKEEINKSWMKKMADEAELDYSEASEDDETGTKDEMTSIAKSKEVAKRKSNLEQKQYELKLLLSQPLTQTGFSGKYPTMSGQLNLPKGFQGSQDTSAIKKLAKETAEKKQITKVFQAEKSKKFKKKQKDRRKKKSKSN